MADLTSVTTPNGHTVTVGQVYADLDPREAGRHVVVENLDTRYAYVRSCPAPGEGPDTGTGRVTRVQLAAFRPTTNRRSGYGLVQEGADDGAP